MLLNCYKMIEDDSQQDSVEGRIHKSEADPKTNGNGLAVIIAIVVPLI